MSKYSLYPQERHLSSYLIARSMRQYHYQAQAYNALGLFLGGIFVWKVLPMKAIMLSLLAKVIPILALVLLTIAGRGLVETIKKGRN